MHIYYKRKRRERILAEMAITVASSRVKSVNLRCINLGENVKVSVNAPVTLPLLDFAGALVIIKMKS